MGSTLEKIELRIVLLCKKNNINFNTQKSEKEVIYNLDDYKLGFGSIKISINESNKPTNASIYGTNDDLFKVAEQIEKERTLFGLQINNCVLSRRDSQNSILIINFDSQFIDDYENNLASVVKSNSHSNIFTDNIEFKPKKKAYIKKIVKKDGVKLQSSKSFRPEFQFLNLIVDALPDENGNVNCYFCVDCKNCKNCIGCIRCSDCEECTNCIDCAECFHCYDSIYCSKCDHCIECNACSSCFYCDGLISISHSGTYCIYSDGIESGIQRNNVLFPDSGCVIYHEKIESFFLINHFMPYHRPYEIATNYNWHIQWKITREIRRYWITEQPTERYKSRYCSIMELAPFFFMNKLQYENWELEAFIKEWFNITQINSVIGNMQPFMDAMLVPKQDGSQTIYDEIKTKNPSECIYNELLYKN